MIFDLPQLPLDQPRAFLRPIVVMPSAPTRKLGSVDRDHRVVKCSKAEVQRAVGGENTAANEYREIGFCFNILVHDTSSDRGDRIVVGVSFVSHCTAT